jgi:tetratricopeptide (TPR) repeat protein
VLRQYVLLQALDHKSRGNDLYKARKFDEALEEYGKAIELYDKDVSFLTNRCDSCTASWVCCLVLSCRCTGGAPAPLSITCAVFLPRFQSVVGQLDIGWFNIEAQPQTLNSSEAARVCLVAAAPAQVFLS